MVRRQVPSNRFSEITARVVQIEAIDGPMAHCVDGMGVRFNIPIAMVRAKGMLPREGEQWVVDQSIGERWTFACILNPQPPTVTGSRGGNSALESLLTVLAEGGLIRDETTA